MVKKIILIFFLSIMIFTFVACNDKLAYPNEELKMYNLLEEHKESIDIYYKAKYPTDNPTIHLKNDYFESRYFVGLQEFITLLCNRSYVYKKEEFNNLDGIVNYINNNTNEKTVYIESHINDNYVKIYVNEDGTVIILKNDILYQTHNNAVNYTRFCDFREVDFLRCYDERNSTMIRLKNDYYSYSYNISSYQYCSWYDYHLDEITYEEAIKENNMTEKKYMRAYRDFLYGLYYYSFFKDVPVYYTLRLPYVSGANLPSRLAYNKYEIGIFGDYYFETSLQDSSRRDEDVLWIFSTTLGSYVKFYKDADEEHLLGLDYLNYNDIRSFVLEENEEINEVLNEFMAEHNIEIDKIE